MRWAGFASAFVWGLVLNSVGFSQAPVPAVAPPSPVIVQESVTLPPPSPVFAPPAGGANFFGATPSQTFAPEAMFTPLPKSKVFAADDPLFPDRKVIVRPKYWSGSAEAGLNGATGNSDILNIRGGFNADRKTDRNLLHSDFLYTLGTQEGRTIQNTAIFNARDEILFPGSRWSFFTSTNIEYDELRLFKFRVGVYAGAGYAVIDDDFTTFKLRAGAGAVREIGGSQDRWVPELVFGYDLKHKFSDRQSIVSNLDYYPRIDDFSQFRVRARLAYEVIIDPEYGLALRLGAQTRYDSNPGPNIARNDLNYFATLAMKF